MVQFHNGLCSRRDFAIPDSHKEEGGIMLFIRGGSRSIRDEDDPKVILIRVNCRKKAATGAQEAKNYYGLLYCVLRGLTTEHFRHKDERHSADA